MFRPKRRFYRPIRRVRPSWGRSRAVSGGRSYNHYDSPDIDRHAIKRIVLTVFFGAALCWFFYFFLLSDNWAIKKIQMNGLSSIPEPEFLSVIKEEVGRKRLFILPNDNILLFSKKTLVRRIEKKYIVEKIDINKELPFTLNIDIKEKEARLVLKAISKMEVKSEIPEDGRATSTSETEIGESPPVVTTIVTSTNYFYLDVNGIVVGAYSLPENENLEAPTLPMVEVEFGSQTLVKPGDVILSSEEIGYIFALYDAIARSSAGIKLREVIYNPLISDELKFVTSESWQGLLSKKLSLETQMRKLEQVLSEKIKDKRRGLQYVDLRVKDRVYFK